MAESVRVGDEMPFADGFAKVVRVDRYDESVMITVEFPVSTVSPTYADGVMVAATPMTEMSESTRYYGSAEQVTVRRDVPLSERLGFFDGMIDSPVCVCKNDTMGDGFTQVGHILICSACSAMWTYPHTRYLSDEKVETVEKGLTFFFGYGFRMNA